MFTLLHCTYNLYETLLFPIVFLSLYNCLCVFVFHITCCVSPISWPTFVAYPHHSVWSVITTHNLTPQRGMISVYILDGASYSASSRVCSWWCSLNRSRRE